MLRLGRYYSDVSFQARTPTLDESMQNSIVVHNENDTKQDHSKHETYVQER